MAAYQRMIAKTDPTQREEALTNAGQNSVPVPETALTVCTTRLRGQLHTILEDMDRYPNAYLEELEAFMTLFEILTSNTPYPSRRYGVSVPVHTKDHEELKFNTPYPEELYTPFIYVKLADIRKDVQCPICLGEASKVENTTPEMLHGLDQLMEKNRDGGVIRSTKSSRSKSTDITKNDRILQISSSTYKKNKVEDHSRIVKSSLNKSNCVVEPSGNANVQHSKLNTNSDLIFKSKSVKKAKKKEEWKPIGKVFTKIRYNWRPTGRTFTLVGNACPLTRITTTNKVPHREPIPLEVVAQESVVTKVYTRRSKVPKTNGSNSKPKIAKSMISNKTEPGTSQV
ncbi:hypothetical protein Tco_0995568 [Tanacetum coccineum]